MAEKKRGFLNQQSILAGVTGLILGALVILGIRFATYHKTSVHYHANFAIYINGQREQLKAPFYYEEVGSGCDTHEELTPHERAHMHDEVNSVVHVHDSAVTWGNFFQNIGWYVDQDVIRDPDGVLLPDATHKISFILNGETVDGVNNIVIKDQDRLLVDYGNSSTDSLKSEFKTVPATAHKYDISKDPASCGGGAPTTLHDRFTHLF